MTNEILLKFLLDQLKALINESKEINQKNKNTIEQFDSMEDQMSDDELECLQDQFEEADLYQPEKTFFGVSNDLAVPSELVEHVMNNLTFNYLSAEFTPDSAVAMSPTDLVLVCSASALTVRWVANKSAIGCNQYFHVDALTSSGRFAPRVTTQSLENNTGYKVWKPGLRSA